METSGAMRRAFQSHGHYVISCDLLPAEDGSIFVADKGGHIQGDVFAAMDMLRQIGRWPSLGIFHPDCTYLTSSAEWAYGDGPYHQQVGPDILVGADRRKARKDAASTVKRILDLDIDQIVVENPVGALSAIIGPPDQIYQPNWFGDDASKATCIWLRRAWPLPRDWSKYLPGRIVEWPPGSRKMVERWSNQTDSGQNRETPSDVRWKNRSRTMPGVAEAFAAHFGRGERPPVAMDLFADQSS